MVGLIPSNTLESRFYEKGANQLNADEKEELIAHLEKMLESLKFGSITLVVQDGKIVQLEKNEKVRLQPNKNR
ncbi:hypothetical protein BABA_03144 [Neobacillus bataviensis LMG 21833]|uniref:DUF2292 domain-containing protein n=1 Tax=Neobacillus bataviensis LMG 21833 TaxID=1117379 RepID=K6EBL6_9BACI|nr:hypothetical protein BABA_03144 [Neobacillus bataviensis LMG 21833]